MLQRQQRPYIVVLWKSSWRRRFLSPVWLDLPVFHRCIGLDLRRFLLLNNFSHCLISRETFDGLHSDISPHFLAPLLRVDKPCIHLSFPVQWKQSGPEKRRSRKDSTMYRLCFGGKEDGPAAWPVCLSQKSRFVVVPSTPSLCGHASSPEERRVCACFRSSLDAYVWPLLRSYEESGLKEVGYCRYVASSTLFFSCVSGKSRTQGWTQTIDKAAGRRSICCAVELRNKDHE